MLPSIAKHASKYGINPIKSYGQNFIFDLSLCNKIVGCSPLKSGSISLEIGPGPGGLTRAILDAHPSKLIVIEKDQRCVELLRDIQNVHPNLEIFTGDALKFDLGQLNAKIHIISNLPYNIGTHLLINWIKSPQYINSMTLMLQKEVVDRINAKHSTKEYGRLSIICQLTCDIQKHFDVSPKAFYPAPKVSSSVVTLVPKVDTIDFKILEIVESITFAAFSKRRKILRSSIMDIVLDEKLFTEIGISLSERPENLSPEQYLMLANLVKNNDDPNKSRHI